MPKLTFRIPGSKKRIVIRRKKKKPRKSTIPNSPKNIARRKSNKA